MTVQIHLPVHTAVLTFLQTVEPFQRQRWGNFRETGWSAHGLFKAHRYHLELNRTEKNSSELLNPPPSLVSFQCCFTFTETVWFIRDGGRAGRGVCGLSGMEEGEGGVCLVYQGWQKGREGCVWFIRDGGRGGRGVFGLSGMEEGEGGVCVVYQGRRKGREGCVWFMRDGGRAGRGVYGLLGTEEGGGGVCVVYQGRRRGRRGVCGLSGMEKWEEGCVWFIRDGERGRRGVCGL